MIQILFYLSLISPVNIINIYIDIIIFSYFYKKNCKNILNHIKYYLYHPKQILDFYNHISFYKYNLCLVNNLIYQMKYSMTNYL